MAARLSCSGPTCNRRLARSLVFERLEDRHLLAVTTLAPVADTFTQAGGSAGSATVLDVRDLSAGNDRMAYIRFDLSGVDIEELSSATLTLYKQAGSRNDTITPGRFEVYGLTNAAGNTPQNWNEATLANGNLGDEYTNTGGDLLDFGQVFNLDADSGANVFESISDGDSLPQSITGADLVTFLNDRIDDDGLVTFIAIVDSGTDDRGWGYASREHVNATLHPKLQLVFEGEEIPDPYPENPTVYTHQMEDLNRGIVALRTETAAYIGWRMLGTDPIDVAFNLYRSENGSAPVLLNGTPLTTTTDFVDTTAIFSQSNVYFVRPVVLGVEQDPSETYTLAAGAPIQQYLSLNLSVPAGGTTPDGGTYRYNSGPGPDGQANDISVGDLDGDGQYELIVKWDPSNSRDNSDAGYTGNTIIDAYRLNGQLMWRIDLGINIRSGAHYVPFIVYDLDGDGKAEVAMKTAPGSKDGEGEDIILPGDDPDADFRNADGRITTGPEYLTIFNGVTGAAMITVPYEPARNNVTTWGDDWGNRSERHLAAVAYLDGVRPSLIFTRGYNGPASGFSTARTDIVAYNWREGELTELWHFKARLGQEGNVNVEYIAQGNHNLSIADIDGDGFDEIIYGAAAIDHDGTGLYSTGLGHGDAIHVSDMDPSNPGLEVFQPHESSGSYGPAGGEFRDAMTGELLLGIQANNDVGRGVAFDIDPNHLGYEMWATTNDPQGAPRMIYNAQGDAIYGVNDISYNFGVWWDADPLRELLDGTTISKWEYDAPTPGLENLVAPGSEVSVYNRTTGLSSNNGSKATPGLVADILGDWREEVIWRTTDSSQLRIWSTTIPSTMRLFTLMHDRQYREAIAWQNVGYNQPPHPSFFLGAGMTTPPMPQIYLATPDAPVLIGDYNGDGKVSAADYTVWRDNVGAPALTNRDPNNSGPVDVNDFNSWIDHYGEVGEGSGAGIAAGQSTFTAAGFAVANSSDELAPLTSLEPRELAPKLDPLAATSRLLRGPRHTPTPVVPTQSVSAIRTAELALMTLLSQRSATVAADSKADVDINDKTHEEDLQCVDAAFARYAHQVPGFGRLRHHLP